MTEIDRWGVSSIGVLSCFENRYKIQNSINISFLRWYNKFNLFGITQKLLNNRIMNVGEITYGQKIRYRFTAY